MGYDPDDETGRTDETMQDRRQRMLTGPTRRAPADTAAPPPGPERQVAIALSDGATAGKAPVIVAKGYGEMAEKILRLAFDNDVKVRQDPELAQILATVELDCEIPLEAFAAVAEILSYVYAANRRLAEEAAAGTPDDDDAAGDGFAAGGEDPDS